MTTEVTLKRWLPYRRVEADARLRLFCFHHAGGGASTFLGWKRWLSDSIELCAVQLPGREQRLREPCVTSLPTLVRAIAREVFAVGAMTDRPFAFFGHSFGARLGFEVARFLGQQGTSIPIHLFLSGCPAPQHQSAERRRSELSHAEFIAELLEFGGTPPGVLEDRDLMEMAVPILRADFAAYEGAPEVGGPALACPITVFGGTDDEISAEQLDGWRLHTTGRFELAMFSGGHFFVAEHGESIVRRITTACEQTLQRAASHSAGMGIKC